MGQSAGRPMWVTSSSLRGALRCSGENVTEYRKTLTK
jgi:hypothetical protein